MLAYARAGVSKHIKQRKSTEYQQVKCLPMLTIFCKYF